MFWLCLCLALFRIAISWIPCRGRGGALLYPWILQRCLCLALRCAAEYLPWNCLIYIMWPQSWQVHHGRDFFSASVISCRAPSLPLGNFGRSPEVATVPNWKSLPVAFWSVEGAIVLSPLGFSLSCRLVFLQRRKVGAAENPLAVLEALEGVLEDHALRVWRIGLLLFLVEVLEGVLSHQRRPAPLRLILMGSPEDLAWTQSLGSSIPSCRRTNWKCSSLRYKMIGSSRFLPVPQTRGSSISPLVSSKMTILTPHLRAAASSAMPHIHWRSLSRDAAHSSKVAGTAPAAVTSVSPLSGAQLGL